jgi:hypothetical protein
MVGYELVVIVKVICLFFPVFRLQEAGLQGYLSIMELHLQLWKVQLSINMTFPS